MSRRARRAVRLMASELKSTWGPRALSQATMSKISRLRSGSPMPCSTTRSSAGNWLTTACTLASVRSAGGSSVRNVRMQIWHSESQRFVVSR
jgi:hypothetical protein